MRYTALFKAWHWLSAFVVSGLVGTVLLRKGFLSYRANSEIIMDKLLGVGVEVLRDDAIMVAKAIRDVMWQWHIILGFMLAFLIVYRVLLAIFDKRDKIPFASLGLHKKGVRVSYYIFYASIVFMALSGFMLHFKEELALAEATFRSIKDLHEIVYNYFLIFIPLHIVGVVVAEVIEKHSTSKVEE
ncbi:MAG: cytochrome b/b6 domain-containing protein [Sulfuricurvum sp.]|jgi:cytochrome b561